jgi:predicted nucleic acid-binding protein
VWANSRSRFGIYVFSLANFTLSAVTLIESTEKVNDCRDAKDDKFLELALAARTDILVSSDIHLLELNPYRGIEIIKLPDWKVQYLDTQK